MLCSGCVWLNLNMEWSKETTVKLIELLRQHESLWNPACDSYRNKNIKHDALKFIAESINSNEIDVEKKIVNLKSQFHREESKARKGFKSGSGTDNIYVSKWYGYEMLQFLKDINKPVKSCSVSFVYLNNFKCYK